MPNVLLLTAGVFASFRAIHGVYAGPSSTQSCSAGYYLGNGGECVLCPDGFFCPGDGSRVACALELGQGVAVCERCAGKTAWCLGSCRACEQLPAQFVCRSRIHEGVSYYVAEVSSSDKTAVIASLAVVSALALCGLAFVVIWIWFKRKHDKSYIPAPEELQGFL